MRMQRGGEAGRKGTAKRTQGGRQAKRAQGVCKENAKRISKRMQRERTETQGTCKNNEHRTQNKRKNQETKTKRGYTDDAKKMQIGCKKK